ncbi:hypothetical protein POM88_006840 [Heracleum sosnowskyi]|uniref:RNase H type-1 domain-containing protein n=1 Tax=Heracleum sosnowskyi TaxID=360622 RepID=A0AAD8N5P2_9APIA|nr:hypothetical protein POM88_006840 [Heracleum sosnowskyi]
MERRWTFPKKHFVKVNTHVVNYPNRLPNGNTMGLGVVIRDHRGVVVMMVSGTIRGLTVIDSELWALLIGLRTLGPLDARFHVVEEDVAAAQQVAEEEVEDMGEWLVQDLGSQSMGVQN